MSVVSKPLAEEHAARQKDPSDFKPYSFRRYMETTPPGIAFIMGKPKNTDKLEVQSVRFNAKEWSLAAAKKWLKENKYKAGHIEEAVGTSKAWSVSVPISKTSSDEQRLAFGWASIVADDSGNAIVDHQKDRIACDELEKAAYDYVKESRLATDMHLRPGVAELVESCVITPEKREAMGIDGDGVTGWWVGFKVTCDDVWAKVKEGTYSEFSIGGTATRKKAES